jgi:TonB family protein
MPLPGPHKSPERARTAGVEQTQLLTHLSGLNLPRKSPLHMLLSFLGHTLGAAAFVWLALQTPKIINKVIDPAEARTELIAPYDGGSGHDSTPASKGVLPKPTPEQFAPPTTHVPETPPALPVEQTMLNAPPAIEIGPVGLPRGMNGPPSDGMGGKGGIGNGSGCCGVGNWATAGKGGVSIPKPIYTPDPDYSDPARQAKVQGAVILWIVVDADGKVQDVRVKRSLGFGLDEKAVEKVRTWKFEPARKDGQPLAVQLNVEVNFHLY